MAKTKQKRKYTKRVNPEVNYVLRMEDTKTSPKWGESVLETARKAQVEVARTIPPTWQGLNDLVEAGMYVMKNINGYQATRIIRIDRGYGAYNQAEGVPQTIAEASQFQKIKE
jgi:hypothetical protein